MSYTKKRESRHGGTKNDVLYGKLEEKRNLDKQRGILPRKEGRAVNGTLPFGSCSSRGRTLLRIGRFINVERGRRTIEEKHDLIALP